VAQFRAAMPESGRRTDAKASHAPYPKSTHSQRAVKVWHSICSALSSLSRRLSFKGLVKRAGTGPERGAGSSFLKGATMLRKFACAAVIVVLGLGVALADEFTAVISKVEDGKVTFKKAKKGSEEMTLPVATTVKVTKGGNYNKDTKKVEDAVTVTEGIKSNQLSNIGDKGVRARITTDADNKHITEIDILKKKAN
jgi:hypothetical protein